CAVGRINNKHRSQRNITKSVSLHGPGNSAAKWHDSYNHAWQAQVHLADTFLHHVHNLSLARANHFPYQEHGNCVMEIAHGRPYYVTSSYELCTADYPDKILAHYWWQYRARK